MKIAGFILHLLATLLYFDLYTNTAGSLEKLNAISRHLKFKFTDEFISARQKNNYRIKIAPFEDHSSAFAKKCGCFALF